MPAEGLPLLEELFRVHRDFTSGFRGGVFLEKILMKLFCAMLISLKDTPFGSLSKERLLEWRWVVQDLMEAKFNILFLLEYFRSVAHAFF